MMDTEHNARMREAIASARTLEARRRDIQALLSETEIDERHVAKLARAFEAAGEVTRDEAAALFALEASGIPKCAAWRPFFVEAVTSHIVWEIRPTGVVNEAQGEWLLLEADRAESLGALAVLVNVLAEAHRVPLWLLAAVRARAARGWSGAHLAIAEAESETAALAA